MKLHTELYTNQIEKWPKSGQHIMAQYDDEKIIVYQSYRPEIGHFAARNQYFGGAFSLSRMTWIKPNFLWMMFRNGWGTKEGQEVVLAIHLKREAFDRYLDNAVYSTYKEGIYASHEAWQQSVKESNVRLQWDPDHDPYGAKLERRAIQLGLRNDEITQYSREDVLEIEDISEFVAHEHTKVEAKDLSNLIVPAEKPYWPASGTTIKKLGLDSH
ncbi:DUF4291 domain-containing protein [Aureisphaera galaxeae]|uniref:DUF4291 domain-containing protein n=1 Tax=Aureisphaera galaxeae TaxID=1538023 RepID=UPI00235018D0|nr:DUF4291 domain-containing protein [Aureisphaera galaxeae]MDC8004321.1 DUF4291 domain-containing protein [Aureisphaera galaxeae]